MPHSVNLNKSDAVPKLGLYLKAFVDQHYGTLPVLKAGLETAQGARFKALEAVTLEYTTLFKIPVADLFELPHDCYNQLLSTEVHAQADLARRLSFETDWVSQKKGVSQQFLTVLIQPLIQESVCRLRSFFESAYLLTEVRSALIQSG